jgi:hypothetical protein
MEGYSVSNQCMALVRDNCLVPTKDAQELGYIRESSGKQYVPDVFYKVCQKFIVCKEYFGAFLTKLLTKALPCMQFNGQHTSNVLPQKH